MTALVSRRLREEARALHTSGTELWRVSEDLLMRARAMMAEARKLEERASELEDMAHVEAMSGQAVRVKRKRAA